jgi:hypothetical protein
VGLLVEGYALQPIQDVSGRCEQWLKEAERCESEGSPRTCEAIIKATVVRVQKRREWWGPRDRYWCLR